MEKKVIVFDMDETIGSFMFLSVYYNILLDVKNLSKKKKKEIFFKILDNNPDIFRKNIFKIFSKLKKYKKEKNIDIVLYTNNNGTRGYTLNIVNYIHDKLKFKLFDKVITQFGTNKIKREGHHKTYNDFIKRYNENVKIIFFDDYNHVGMNHKNVKYILLKAYNYSINYSKFIIFFKKINSKFKYLTESESKKYLYYLNEFTNQETLGSQIKNYNESEYINDSLYKFLNIKIKEKKIILPIFEEINKNNDNFITKEEFNITFPSYERWLKFKNIFKQIYPNFKIVGLNGNTISKNTFEKFIPCFNSINKNNNDIIYKNEYNNYLNEYYNKVKEHKKSIKKSIKKTKKKSIKKSIKKTKKKSIKKTKKKSIKKTKKSIKKQKRKKI